MTSCVGVVTRRRLPVERSLAYPIIYLSRLSLSQSVVLVDPLHESLAFDVTDKPLLVGMQLLGNKSISKQISRFLFVHPF